MRSYSVEVYTNNNSIYYVDIDVEEMTVDVREGEWLKITPPTGCFESELPPKWEDSKDGSEVEDASPEPND
ncbi:MAG: hypothetical protein ACKVH8_13685 [Pirellulales bacterium]